MPKDTSSSATCIEMAGWLTWTTATAWEKLSAILPKTSALISAGKAICGGSAVAAVNSMIGVAEGEITVAMGSVFIPNAAALYPFPVLGYSLHLSQTQFGTCAGVAIHDSSSVVSAASHYGLSALQTATAVKLARAPYGSSTRSDCRSFGGNVAAADGSA